MKQQGVTHYLHAAVVSCGLQRSQLKPRQRDRLAGPAVLLGQLQKERFK
jgi:hypothetical protein